MTESEWQNCTAFERLLPFVLNEASERKLRLLACAFCRQLGRCIEDERSRTAVEVAERFADGTATKQELSEAKRALKADYRTQHRAEIAKKISEPAAFEWAIAWDTSKSLLRVHALDAVRETANCMEVALRCGLKVAPLACLRDLFGTELFRPTTIQPAWLRWQK